MKKAFIILIAVVFFVAVVYVGVNGLQIKPPFDSRIYVTSVECKEYKMSSTETTVEMKYSESSKMYYATIYISPTGDVDQYGFQLLPKGYPENATCLGAAEGGIFDDLISIGKNEYPFKYVYTGDLLTVNEKGVVTLATDEYGFIKTGVATITIKSADENAYTTVQILIREPKN